MHHGGTRGHCEPVHSHQVAIGEFVRAPRRNDGERCLDTPSGEQIQCVQAKANLVRNWLINLDEIQPQRAGKRVHQNIPMQEDYRQIQPYQIYQMLGFRVTVFIF